MRSLPTIDFISGAQVFRHIDVRGAVGDAHYARMPYAARILAENLLRTGADAALVTALVRGDARPGSLELPLKFPRVILPDSSGIPVLMDLAALRSALHRRGLPAEQVQSQVPITLIVDHSLQVDVAGEAGAPAANLAKEYQRNGERYRFLKWAQQAFPGMEIFPPGSGIIHQVHLERVAQVVWQEDMDGTRLVYPDMVVGGDSHTPMVNALGIIGWGVGGLEAEMVALGEPYPLPNPEFIGVELSGALGPQVSMTDLALTLTHLLRQHNVIGAFIEFFGSAVAQMSVPDRATLANMAPEYGATTGFWPVDAQTLDYLAMTARSADHIALVRDHAQSAGLFRHADAPTPDYARVIKLDLASVKRSLAGPAKPHALTDTAGLKGAFLKRIDAPQDGDGAVAIAAITSCTNTANPVAMLSAGLLARNAVARGLRVRDYVKTSLAPGSRAVTAYLREAGLLAPLEALGFHVIGYGCTTCGGKSGPLKPEAQAALAAGNRMVAVLSGNRNFDGRIHRLLNASFLASPALVVAYALAGTIMRDLDVEPLGQDSDGADVYLRDLWPDTSEIAALMAACLKPEMFTQSQGLDAEAVALWSGVEVPGGALFDWDLASTYIVEPPFFEDADGGFGARDHVKDARVLGFFEDGLTTDHVSPGGEIPPTSPAGAFLQAAGIAPANFNSYVGRRGNHHVMTRGTYANLRIRNLLTPEREGWWTRLFPEGTIVSIYDAAEHYRAQGVPLIVLGGRDFGSGSSRDWAAKGPALLGVSGVLARSFERIHRSNLIGLGILPLLFAQGEHVESLGLTGAESFSFAHVQRALAGQGPMEVVARAEDGRTTAFSVTIDARTQAERDLLRQGGVFRAALARQMRI